MIFNSDHIDIPQDGLLEDADNVLMKSYSSFYHQSLVQCQIENRLPINVH